MQDSIERIIIHAKDISLIAGVNERTGFRILERIRKQLGKQPHAYVSVTEFCRYMKLDPREVRASLR